jgi:acetyltransferase-like isoleucine patch superfamily enzyme
MLIQNPAGIWIGAHTFIRDYARLEVVNRPGLPSGQILIGDHVGIEQNVHIAAVDRITIGDEVTIAPRCTILDSVHPLDGPSHGRRSDVVESARAFVHIARRAMLGANVVILPNVSIGENAVIGANSVVNRDVPANVVAAGAPARVLREIRT